MTEIALRLFLCFVNGFITFWCFRFLSNRRIHPALLAANILAYSFVNYFFTFAIKLNSVILSFNGLIIITIVWLSILFHENIIYTTVYCFFSDAIESISFLLCTFMFIELFQCTWQEITAFTAISFLLTIVFQATYFLFLYTVLKSMKHLLAPVMFHQDKYFLLLVFLPSLAFNLMFDFLQHNIPIAYVFIIFLSLTVMFVFTFLFFKRFIKAEREQNNQQMILQTISHTEEYLQTITSNQKELRKIKHDLMNQMIIVQQMLTDKQYDQLAQYLDHMKEKIQAQAVPCHSGNIYIDALFNHKRNEHPEIEFDIQFTNIEEALLIDVFTFCSLLGNVLDNAIEAVEKTDEKWISFRCIIKENEVFIRIKNPISQVSDLKTNKDKPLEHGLGMEIIDTIVSQYDGNIDIDQSDHIFDICIDMKNRKNTIT